MYGDWIKLHRRALAHPVFSDESLWRLFSWCLLKANFRDGAFMGQRIPRGSFATGRNAAAEELGDKPSTIYKRLGKLVELGCISMESNNQFTTITICNYKAYQSFEEEDSDIFNNGVTTKEQRSNNGVTTKEQRSSTIEEGKNERREEWKNERKEEGLLLLSEKLKAVVPARYATADVFEALGRWEEVYPSRNKGNRLNAITLQAQLKESTSAGWDAIKLVRAIDLSIAKNAPYLYDPDHKPGGNGSAPKKKTALEEYGECPLPD